jgi:hypothetical protein
MGCYTVYILTDVSEVVTAYIIGPIIPKDIRLQQLRLTFPF